MVVFVGGGDLFEEGQEVSLPSLVEAPAFHIKAYLFHLMSEVIL